MAGGWRDGRSDVIFVSGRVRPCRRSVWVWVFGPRGTLLCGTRQLVRALAWSTCPGAGK